MERRGRALQALATACLILLLHSASAFGLIARMKKKPQHTLEDLIVQSVAPEDVAHVDVMRFVREGVQYSKERGVQLSQECEKRYGYSFIEDQRSHHFRMCKSAVTKRSDGTLAGVPTEPSALGRLRAKLARKLARRVARMKEAASTVVHVRRLQEDAGDSGSSSGGGYVRQPLTADQRFRQDYEDLTDYLGKEATRKLLQDAGVQLPVEWATSYDAEVDPLDRSASGAGLTARERMLRFAGQGPGATSSSQSALRRLQETAASGELNVGEDESGSNTLMLQIMKFVHDKKDDGDDDGSDIYNADGDPSELEDDDDGDEEDEAEGEDQEGAGGGSSNSDGGGGGGGAAGGGEQQQDPLDTVVNGLIKGGSSNGGWHKRRDFQPVDFVSDQEEPQYDARGTDYKSYVGCYLQPTMPRNLGHKDALLLCLGRNVVLDSCAYYDGQNQGFDVRFPKPKVGAVKLGCEIEVTQLNDRNLTKGYKNRMLWVNAEDNAYDVVRSSCDPAKGHVVDHPVAFLVRDRYTHTLHELEMLSAIFTSLAVTDLPEVREKGIQILIADQMPHASYRPTYAAISYPYRLRHLAADPYPPNTCFRTALFINAFTNSLAFNPNANLSDCFSPLMVGFHKWLRTLHQELDPAHLARMHAHASETGGIVRRNVVWTSRRNLEALRLTSGVGMTEWQSARMVPNEDELVAALNLAILRWNSRSCLLARYYRGDAGMAGCRDSPVQFDLVFGEFSDWPYYPDQLMTVYRSGVLIGVHGAALTFVSSTPLGESALLELAGYGWEETQTGNMLTLFPSLAHNLGAYYEQVRYQGPKIDIKIATDALIRAMDEVSRRIVDNTARRAAAAGGAPKPRFNDQFNFDVMFPQTCKYSSRRIRRYVTNHPVQMNLNTTAADVVASTVTGNTTEAA